MNEMDTKQQIIEQTLQFVKGFLKERECGHDILHIERVENNALAIAATEPNADLFLIRMCVLLHDVPDSKFYDGDEEKGMKIVEDYLSSLDLDAETRAKITFILKNMSFKHSFGKEPSNDINFQIVQDADRLDAIGAIGIARTFSYGGHKGTAFYDDTISPQHFSDTESYKNAKSTTINHFYEKLLLLKDLMNTQKAKEMAQHRHEFMLSFLDEFQKERFSKD